MRVKVTQKQRIQIHGFIRTYQVGDIVDIGKQAALKLYKQGKVELVDKPQDAPLPPQAQPVNLIVGKVPSITVYKHDYSLIWDGQTSLPYQRMVQGFGLLNVWEIAVPLFDYKTLAIQLGTEDERERTKAIIRDLRVPVHNTGLMFVRHCESTELLMQLWREETQEGDDPRLAFLRALYQAKPMLLPLPVTWAGGSDVV